MTIKSNKDSIKKLNNNYKLTKTAIFTGVLTTTLLLTGCNQTVLDTKYGFDKALILGDDSAIILDVEQWKDYSGEQIQLTTNDNFVLLTSSFDTNCFYGNSDNYSINNIANSAIVNDEVYHLTEDNTKNKTYNKDIFDTNWTFNKSITFNGNKALILPVGFWNDYSGEQLQLNFNDNSDILSSFVNVTLVSPKTDGIEEVIAKAFSGDLENSKNLVKKYK